MESKHIKISTIIVVLFSISPIYCQNNQSIKKYNSLITDKYFKIDIRKMVNFNDTSTINNIGNNHFKKNNCCYLKAFETDSIFVLLGFKLYWLEKLPKNKGNTAQCELIYFNKTAGNGLKLTMNSSLSIANLGKSIYRLDFLAHYEFSIDEKKILVNNKLDELISFNIIWFWHNLPKNLSPHTYINMLGDKPKYLSLNNENYEEIPLLRLMNILNELYKTTY